MEKITMEQFEEKINFNFEVLNDQLGTMYIKQVKTNQLLGEIEIKADNIEQLHEKAEKCKMDHYNFMRELLLLDYDKQVKFFEKLSL